MVTAELQNQVDETRLTEIVEPRRDSLATRLMLAVDYYWWLRTILLWAFCGWLSWTFTWAIHPSVWGQWNAENVLANVVWFLAIIVLVFLSCVTLSSGKGVSSLIRWTLTAQSIVYLAVTLGGFFLHLYPSTSIFFVFGLPVCLILLVLRPWREPAAHIRLYHASILIAVLAPIVALLAWSELNIGIVGRDADRIAAGNAYCLQVPGDRLGGYAAVTSRRQLAGLRMQTPFTNGGGSGDFQFAFHAVLIVQDPAGDQFYNWSYRNQAFQRWSTWTSWKLSERCNPAPNFFSTLQ